MKNYQIFSPVAGSLVIRIAWHWDIAKKFILQALCFGVHGVLVTSVEPVEACLKCFNFLFF